DALLARVVKHNVELSGTVSVDRKVEILRDMADDLDGHARSLAHVAQEKDLNELADLYDAVLRGDKGLVALADTMGGDRRKVLEPIIAHLLEVTATADRMSREVPPSATASLQTIARAAREAHSTLSRKIR